MRRDDFDGRIEQFHGLEEDVEELREIVQRKQVTPGKRPLTARLPAPVTVIAREGVADAGVELPHLDAIQRSFGHHHLGGVRAHVGGAAADAATQIGATAYATGNDVAFATTPDLHTAAHEAAHVVQQRGGVQLRGGVGEEGDAYERNADAVADAVVRGESAQPLLDQVAAPGAAAATGTQRKVQRRAAQEIALRHLGSQSHTIQPLATGTPVPASGIEVFSGELQATVDYEAQPGPDLDQAFSELRPNISPGEQLPGGTVGSHVEGAMRTRRPDLYNAILASMSIAAGGRNLRTVRATIGENVYQLEAYQAQMLPLEATIPYQRADATDGIAATLAAGSPPERATITGRQFILRGSHRLITAGDGQYLAQLTAQRLSPPWTALIKSQPESEAFKQMLLATSAGAAAKDAWYQWARTGIFDGQAARDWITATIDDESGHFNMVRSLQHFIVAGIGAANADLDQYVDAVRALIREPATSARVRTVLQNRVVNSYFWGEIRLSVADFPSQPGAVPAAPTPAGTGAGTAVPEDTQNAQFDLVRLAGEVLATRQLLPTLQSALDPVSYMRSYPMSDGATPASDLMDQLVADATSMKQRIRQFIDGITPQQLGPAAFNLGNPQARPGPHSGLDASQQRLAIEAGRIGAAQRIIAAISTSRTGDFVKHIAVHLSMAELATSAASTAQRAGMPVSLQLVASGGAARLGPQVEADSRELIRQGERMSHRRGASADDRQRGQDLVNFANLFINYAQSHDLAALRGQLSGNVISISREVNLDLIRSHLANQAAIAATNVSAAFEHAYTRMRQALIEDIRGKIAEHRGGSPWVSTLGGVAGLGVGIIDFIGNAAQAGIRRFGIGRISAGGATTLTTVAPGLAVVGAAIGGIISIRNWFVERELAQQERQIIGAADTALDRFRTRSLGAVNSAARAEQAHYAAGRVRRGDGFASYVHGLAGDTQGSPPGQVDVSGMDVSALDEALENVLAAPPVAYTDIYNAQHSAVSLRVQDLWRSYEQQINGLPSTI